jgi:hypothetical protein
MEKYEILLIILVISFFSVAFRVVIEELTINKVLNVKKIAIIFSSKNSLIYWKTIKEKILYYHHYQLEDLPLDHS